MHFKEKCILSRKHKAKMWSLPCAIHTFCVDINGSRYAGNIWDYVHSLLRPGREDRA